VPAQEETLLFGLAPEVALCWQAENDVDLLAPLPTGIRLKLDLDSSHPWARLIAQGILGAVFVFEHFMQGLVGGEFRTTA
jgi:hypothetical protein